MLHRPGLTKICFKNRFRFSVRKRLQTKTKHKNYFFLEILDTINQDLYLLFFFQIVHLPFCLDL